MEKITITLKIITLNPRIPKCASIHPQSINLTINFLSTITVESYNMSDLFICLSIDSKHDFFPFLFHLKLPFNDYSALCYKWAKCSIFLSHFFFCRFTSSVVFYFIWNRFVLLRWMRWLCTLNRSDIRLQLNLHANSCLKFWWQILFPRI